MLNYLYDGSFEGLLTCIYHHYYTEKAQGIYPKEEYQATLLSEYREAKTEEKKAAIVYHAIEKKISSFDLRRVYKVYRSTVKEKEIKILNYIRLGFQNGARIRLLHGNSIVKAMQDAEQKVNLEIHRFMGLLRFSELAGGLMYSTIEPDHDLLEFLATHFCDRFKNQPFIIHDIRRSKGLIAYEGQWYITDFTRDQIPAFSEEEETCRQLWKSYFEHIAIKERTNPRCQKNMMPVRYWKHLSEFQEVNRIFRKSENDSNIGMGYAILEKTEEKPT